MTSRTDTNGSSKLLHFLDLDNYGLKEVSSEQKEDAKNEVADFLLNESLRQINKGTSPVKGEGRFRILDAKYSTVYKGGVRTANLELEGDLKDSFKVKSVAGSFLSYGHEGGEVPKADGHNQISNKAKTWAIESRHPKRRYIPDSNQVFTDSITTEIKSILKDFKSIESDTATVDIFDDLDIFTTVGTTTSSVTPPAQRESGDFITIDNLFSDDVIGALLADALRRR